MNLQLFTTWFIETNPDELNLIVAALEGRLLGDAQREQATTLAQSITRLRAEHSQKLATQMVQSSQSGGH